MATVIVGSNYTQIDTFTTTGVGTTVDLTANPFKHYTVMVTGTGNPATTWSVVLEGSLDGVNFTPIMTHTNLISDSVALYSGIPHYPSRFVRANVKVLVLGLATNIVVTSIGVE